jgi:hypothetical protein
MTPEGCLTTGCSPHAGARTKLGSVVGPARVPPEPESKWTLSAWLTLPRKVDTPGRGSTLTQKGVSHRQEAIPHPPRVHVPVQEGRRGPGRAQAERACCRPRAGVHAASRGGDAAPHLYRESVGSIEGCAGGCANSDGQFGQLSGEAHLFGSRGEDCPRVPERPGRPVGERAASSSARRACRRS